MPKCTSAKCNSRSAIPGSPLSEAGRATDHTCRQEVSLATGDYADGRLRCQLTIPSCRARPPQAGATVLGAAWLPAGGAGVQGALQSRIAPCVSEKPRLPNRLL